VKHAVSSPKGPDCISNRALEEEEEKEEEEEEDDEEEEE